jgi:predicted lipoprotein with Yx(FWY)xxD motif
MSRRTALRLSTAILAVAAVGCSGYSNGLGIVASDASIADASRISDAAPLASQPPSKPRADADSDPPDATEPPEDEPVIEPPPSAPTPMPMPMDASQPAMEIDASHAMQVDAAADADAELRLESSASFDGYITDSAGEPLYMFVGDVTRSNETACLAACASTWPPFDLQVKHVSAGLDLEQVARFHRQDGAWQTTYKGHPLYRRASEEGARDVTTDGAEGRWFVARDYLAFMSAARTFAPAGGMGTNGPFLTDGFGRTLYVCIEDEPATGMLDPVTSCTGDCILRRPVFGPMAGDTNQRLPSVIDPNELKQYTRADGMRQFSYRGWPLYYFSGDLVAGATEGHNDGAWRAFDPVEFGLIPEPSPNN